MAISKEAGSIGTRRQVLESMASAVSLVLVGCAAAPSQPRVTSAADASSKSDSDSEKEAEVTPAEDLMQEHGLIERVLLIYDEVAGRVERGEAADLSLVGDAASIVKTFVEAYHEQLEEGYVFSRLKDQQGQLVSTLTDQHEKGRTLTERITRLSQGSDRAALARDLRSFTRMYRPHAAWEDTVLFPAFRRVVGREQYRELGEKFEEEEHQRFGEHGFEDILARVAKVEQGLDMADLSKFTPA
jgi:hemerythrin-like domain-containing protein